MINTELPVLRYQWCVYAPGNTADDVPANDDVAGADPAPAPAPVPSASVPASPAPAGSAASVPVTAQPDNLAELSAQLRDAAAEIAEIAAQAGRLGIAIDGATALREGSAPEALRRLVLERASAAADARDIVAAAPSPRRDDLLDRLRGGWVLTQHTARVRLR